MAGSGGPALRPPRNVRRILAGLAHANAFVEESPGAPGGFRIHPLFREMLQAQLGLRAPRGSSRPAPLCRGLVRRGRPVAGGGRARVAAEDWGFVTRLLIDDLLVTRLLAHGRTPPCRGCGIPPASLRGPEAAVIRAAIALAGGHQPRTGPDLAASVRAAATTATGSRCASAARSPA